MVFLIDQRGMPPPTQVTSPAGGALGGEFSVHRGCAEEKGG